MLGSRTQKQWIEALPDGTSWLACHRCYSAATIFGPRPTEPGMRNRLKHIYTNLTTIGEREGQGEIKGDANIRVPFDRPKAVNLPFLVLSAH